MSDMNMYVWAAQKDRSSSLQAHSCFEDLDAAQGAAVQDLHAVRRAAGSPGVPQGALAEAWRLRRWAQFGDQEDVRGELQPYD